VLKDLKINSGGSIAWAVHKNNPELLRHLNAFIKKNRKGSLLGNILFKRYYTKSKWIKNPTTEKEHRKLEKLTKLFEAYADRYGFNWLAIAAQAYQESGLDQRKKNPTGAIGIMQILPSTAADKSVNVKNIEILENNIHAGVKYLDFLRTRYFNEPGIKPAARVDFAWAAYNAGPAKINRLRKKAAESGFDPNIWFFNVEKIAAREIGRETVDYVANINKYFIAYTLFYEADLKRKKQLKALGVSTKAPSDKKKTIKKTKTNRSSEIKKSAKPTPRYHTVRSGETLYGISRKYGLTVKELTRLNRISTSTIIKPGDKLKIGP
jgi:membrane-bound lytic murein transglycosylase MltF